MNLILTNHQTIAKDCFAGNAKLGLGLLSNGEEWPAVLDADGNYYRAGIAAPTTAPTGVASGSGGGLTPNKWVAYVYCYAATTRFPFVESTQAIGGSLAPRSNPSPFFSFQVTSSGEVTLTLTKANKPHIDKIWIFRTEEFTTQIEAETAAAGGQAFYIGSVNDDGNVGTVTFVDNGIVGVDQVETDNYESPQFRYCLYANGYFWGIGNNPRKLEASWSNLHTGGTALLTLATNKWFVGRNGQTIRLQGITTGGIDGKGTYRFRWLSDTTATLYKDNFYSPVALPSSGQGWVLIQGPAGTLYRSKKDNPFAWGYTELIDQLHVPKQYAFKVAGGNCTAIAQVPNEDIMKLDFEEPAATYTLNLSAAGDDSFESTLKLLSDVYSVSVHHSQFPAVNSDGVTVLWGMDFKNYCIVESNGQSVIPVSNTALPKVFRALTKDKSKQQWTHGVYDARTELNAIWTSSANCPVINDICIYQHAPTGFWGVSIDYDISASAKIFDTRTGEHRTYVGTSKGLIGIGFAENFYENWNPPTGRKKGTIIASGGNWIRIDTTERSFNVDDIGVVGNWVLLSEPNKERWARVSQVSSDTLYFDRVIGNATEITHIFDVPPVIGTKFYLGLIECSLLKYFDMDNFGLDKRLKEIWLLQQNDDGETSVRFCLGSSGDWHTINLIQNQSPISLSDVWFAKHAVKNDLSKYFGIEIRNRGFSQWKFSKLLLIGHASD